MSADENAWNGQPWVVDLTRYLEYTDNKLIEKYAELTDSIILELMRFPCIFAYEAPLHIDPKFGLIREINLRGKNIKLTYEIVALDKFLTYDEFSELGQVLDITGWEPNRTHWAIKNVDLAKELYSIGIKLPNWVNKDKKSVDITKHHFDVSFSFPGEIRPYVESIAFELERMLGPNSYFYDNNYKAQLARPSLHHLLQDIYRNRSKLIVVFLCQHYQEKEWCGLEFRAISELLMKRKNEMIMYIKVDDGRVDGVFETDGYIDARHHNPQDVAGYIVERTSFL